ncbi:MAG TPA: hypothetical protein PLP83_00325 [Candidatus Aminicenantes bacterium]|nr:hypothetical protein [Candidatus Aminicenantes bacterium]
MPESIKVARIALVVAAGLKIATAALFLFIFGAGAVLIGWGTDRAGLLGSALLGAAGVVLALFCAAVGALDLAIAAGIAKGRPWARLAGVAMGAVLLVGFPVGTVLGALVLMGLLGKDARDWFGVPRVSPPAAPVAPPAA